MVLPRRTSSSASLTSLVWEALAHLGAEGLAV